jgi:glycosyltransferase involved in cell wall biosynthesis
LGDFIRTFLRKLKAALQLGISPPVDEAEFDRDWYLKQYPDVRASGMDPLEHYRVYGRKDGRDPGPRHRASSRLAADWDFLGKSRHMARDPQARPRQPRAAVAQASLADRIDHDKVGPSLNIVFINHGPYDSNSGLHIDGFANALAARGHRVVVSATGAISDAGDFGLPRFRCISHQKLRDRPDRVTDYFAGAGKPDLIHCWTPRQAVYDVARLLIDRYHCPYIVHFEDSETAVSKAYAADGGLRGSAPPVRLAPRDEFVRGASSATIIVDALKDVLPAGMRCHLLEPGVDTVRFAPSLEAGERERLCAAIGVPTDAWITVYPGNVHPANYEDMFSLYTAVHALNARGHKVHLIRTGIDTGAVDPRFVELSRRYVTNLGFVRRDWLVELLKLADFFVQPGGPDDFNRYRLPSKLPELLAIGKAVVLPNTNIGLLMQDGVDALLMRRGDAAEITGCVEAILTDPERAARMGEGGRRFAIEHFNWERSARGLEDFYRTVLGR